MKGAGALWYNSSDHYLAMSVVDWLGWYHSWGLTQLPDTTRTLLDIGCADGRFVYAAARRGIEARGIDHSERLIESGNRRYGGMRLSRMSVEELANAHDRYDAVTLFEVIEHVEQPRRLLEEARSVLTENGVLVVSTPNRLGRPHPPGDLDRPPHHLTRWSPTALRNALSRAGLSAVEIGMSPGHIGIQEMLLGFRFGLVVGALRRRRAAPRGGPTDDRDLRAAILAKERAAAAIAAIASPFVGRFFRGGHMVAIARPAIRTHG